MQLAQLLENVKISDTNADLTIEISDIKIDFDNIFDFELM